MAKGWSFSALINALRGAAFLDVGTSAGTVAAGDDSRIVNAVQRTGDTMGGSLAVRVNQAAIALRPVSDGQTNYLVGKNAANNLDVWFAGLRDSDSVKFGRQGYGELYFKDDGTSGWVNPVSGQSLLFNDGGDIFYRSASNGVHYFNSDVEIQSSGISLKIAPDADNEPSYIAGSNAAKTGTTWRVGKIGVGADIVVANLVSGQAIGLSSNGNMYYDVANNNFQHIFGQTVIAPAMQVGNLTATKAGGGEVITVKTNTASTGAWISLRNSANAEKGQLGILPDGTTIEFKNVGVPASVGFVRILSDGQVNIGSDVDVNLVVSPTGAVGARGMLTAGSARYGTDGNIVGTVWGTNAKAYVDSGLATKLGVSANAVSATKLQTPRNINGVPFDGTADIQLDKGLVVHAWGSYALFGNQNIILTAIDANHLTFTMTWEASNNFVQLNKTKVSLVSVDNDTEVIPGSTTTRRRKKIGDYTITGLTLTGSIGANAVFTILSTNHGVTVGQSVTLGLCAFIYDQVGMTVGGQVAAIQYCGSAIRLELDTPVSSQSVPIFTRHLQGANSNGGWAATTEKIYGSQNVPGEGTTDVASGFVFADLKTVGLTSAETSSNTWYPASLISIVIHNIV